MEASGDQFKEDRRRGRRKKIHLKKVFIFWRCNNLQQEEVRGQLRAASKETESQPDDPD